MMYKKPPRVMDKKEAIEIFGNVQNIADAFQTSIQNFYKFEDPLTLANSDRIIGAAMRTGRKIPDSYKSRGL